MENSNFSQGDALTIPLPSDGAPQHRHGIPAYLNRRKGLVLVAAALGIILAGWTWFGASAVLPLLYSLPCTAMMAMCMRDHGRSGSAPTKPNDSAGSGPECVSEGRK
jgi:hypothetical protein